MQGTPDNLRDTIRERFAKVASEPNQETTFPVGSESAKKLGYDAAEIDALPASLTESFCGVGNPLALGDLGQDDTVLDLGSGAGLDCVLAARRVRPSGHVIGVDMTEEMIDKAWGNAKVVRLSNLEFRYGRLESLPIDDASVTVAITNGVFNLCPDKPKALAEAFRVLRPGGRLWMADILLHEDVTPEEVASKGMWSD